MLASLFATGTWWLYRRQTATENRGERLAWLLPLLRTAAVILLIFMLTGPIWRHHERVGEFGKVLVFIDASESMSLHDEHMDVARKLMIAMQRGWLSADDMDTSLVEVADELRGARGLIEQALQGRTPSMDARSLAGQFQSKLESIREHMGQINVSSLAAGSHRSGAGNILREYW